MLELPAPPSDHRSFRILVAEDDRAIARLILVHLQKAGFDARLACDGVMGVEAFHDFKPHLLLTDINMPCLNGNELAAKVREESAIPIIMMTAADSDSAQVKGFKSGADDYVAKPFSPNVLVARVIAHLRRVYRYSAAEASPTGLPEGWSKCQSCGYVGPQAKFIGQNPERGPTTQCPNCKMTEITFEVT